VPRPRRWSPACSICLESTCDAGSLHEACLFLADFAHRAVNEGLNVTWQADHLVSLKCGDTSLKCDNGRVYSDCADSCVVGCGWLGLDVGLL